MIKILDRKLRIKILIVLYILSTLQTLKAFITEISYKLIIILRISLCFKRHNNPKLLNFFCFFFKFYYLTKYYFKPHVF